MNDPSQMMNRGFGIWQPPPPLPPLPPPLPLAVDDPMVFQTHRPGYYAGPGPGRMMKNWQIKKDAAVKRKKAAAAAAAGSGGGGGTSGYKPPKLNELQFQNRVKARKFYPKKKHGRFAPYAPRNTTSFIIRAKKSGGIASLVSPCPVTPAILPTPKFSPSREGLVDMAKEEWGVDGYGSMKGLIRLRSPTGIEMAGDSVGWAGEEEEEEEEVVEEDGSSDSDAEEEHLEMERRLDHDLSRFEMVYPNVGDDQTAAAATMENRMDDQDTHIAHLEEENLTLKERLFLMEREMGDLRRRLLMLEARDNNNNNTAEINIKHDDENDSGDDNNDDNCNLNVGEEASEYDANNDNIDGNDLNADKEAAPENDETPMCV